MTRADRDIARAGPGRRQGDPGAGPRRRGSGSRKSRPATSSGPPSATARRSGRPPSRTWTAASWSRRRDDQHAARAPGQPDAAAGVILDGFPRNAAQAEALDRALAGEGQSVEVAPYIEIDEDEIVHRLGSRWVCRAAGTCTTTQVSPPQGRGRLRRRRLGAVPARRRQARVVRARLVAQLPPLYEVVDHYRRAGRLVSVDGGQAIEGVTAALSRSRARRRRREGAC